MNRILPLIIGALLLAGGAAFYMSRTGGSLPGVSVALAQEVDADVELAPDMVIGNVEAPITIVEYASYTCPHCANFHTDVFKQLKVDYIDSGQVRFVHREVYFDRFGLWAGMLARCGGEMRYFGMNDMIYGQQQEWIGSGDPQEVLNNLRKLGRTAGMSDEQMNTCLEDETMAQSMVAAYQQNATADEISATPSFVINGEKYSNMPYSEFRKLLDGLLEN